MLKQNIKRKIKRFCIKSQLNIRKSQSKYSPSAKKVSTILKRIYDNNSKLLSFFLLFYLIKFFKKNLNFKPLTYLKFMLNETIIKMNIYLIKKYITLSGVIVNFIKYLIKIFIMILFLFNLSEFSCQIFKKSFLNLLSNRFIIKILKGISLYISINKISGTTKFNKAFLKFKKNKTSNLNKKVNKFFVAKYNRFLNDSKINKNGKLKSFQKKIIKKSYNKFSPLIIKKTGFSNVLIKSKYYLKSKFNFKTRFRFYNKKSSKRRYLYKRKNKCLKFIFMHVVSKYLKNKKYFSNPIKLKYSFKNSCRMFSNFSANGKFSIITKFYREIFNFNITHIKNNRKLLLKRLSQKFAFNKSNFNKSLFDITLSNQKYKEVTFFINYTINKNMLNYNKNVLSKFNLSKRIFL